MMEDVASGIFVMLLMFAAPLLLIMPWSCEASSDVARCVERCETLPHGCSYDETHGTTHGQGRFCRCQCDWPLPLAPLDGGGQ